MSDPASSNYDELYLITQRFAHHAGPSGYDRLAASMPGHVIAAQRPKDAAGRALAKLLGPLARRAGSIWYHRECALAELRAVSAWMNGSRRLFHYLYGENLYRYLGDLKRTAVRRNWIVGTYHTPDWRFREVVSDARALRHLDAVIVVSSVQIPFFSEFVGEDRVHFVPHGVDVGFFAPRRGERSCDGFRVLTVGHHLRDFAALAAVAESLAGSHAHVTFDVVARADALGPLRGLANVRCHSGVSDEGLRTLYQQANVLFLPLRDATANNSLLEGMACGLPVIATDLPGVRDYIRDDGCVFTPRADVEALRHELLALSEDACRAARMGMASRAAAETFAWPAVAAQTRQVYSRVAAS